jgi:hypothetical protein
LPLKRLLAILPLREERTGVRRYASLLRWPVPALAGMAA